MMTKAGSPLILLFLEIVVLLIKKWRGTAVHQRVVFISHPKKFMINGIVLSPSIILQRIVKKNSGKERKEVKYLIMRELGVVLAFMAPGPMMIILSTGIKTGPMAVFR